MRDALYTASSLGTATAPMAMKQWPALRGMADGYDGEDDAKYIMEPAYAGVRTMYGEQQYIARYRQNCKNHRLRHGDATLLPFAISEVAFIPSPMHPDMPDDKTQKQCPRYNVGDCQVVPCQAYSLVTDHMKPEPGYYGSQSGRYQRPVNCHWEK